MTFPKTKIWKCHFFVVPLHQERLPDETGRVASAEKGIFKA